MLTMGDSMWRKSLALVVLALTLLPLGAWLLCQARPAERTIGMAADPGGFAASVREPRRRPVQQAADPAPVPTEPARSSARAPTLSGSLEVSSGDVWEAPGPRGTMEILAEGRTVPVQVDVIDGHWHLDGTAAGTLRVVDIEFEGRRAACVDESYQASEEDAVRVRARWLPQVQLHVKGPEGLDLTGVDVLEGLVAEPGRHPGRRPRGEFLVRNGASPLWVPLERASTVLWVRADGHAWSRLAVEGSEADRLVYLETARTLTITVPAEGPIAGIHLEVFRRSAEGRVRVLSDLGIRAAPLEVDSLPPGLYEVVARSGGRGGLVVGTASCDLTSRSSAAVTLDLGGLGEARIEGRVHLPPGTPTPRRLEVVVRRLEGVEGFPEKGIRAVPTPDGAHPSGGAEGYSWSVEGLTPSVYSVVLLPFLSSAVVDLTESGDGSVDFDLPELSTLWIEAQDETTGERIALSAVTVSCLDSTLGGLRSAPTEAASEGATRQRFRLEVVPGELEVLCVAPDHGSQLRSVHVGPGDEHLTFRLRRKPGFSISLRDGTQRISMPFEFWNGIRVRPEGHAGAQEAMTLDGAPMARSARFLFAEAGTYSVEFGEVPNGYLPVPSMEVTLQDHGGAASEYVIDLVRWQ